MCVHVCAWYSLFLALPCNAIPTMSLPESPEVLSCGGRIQYGEDVKVKHEEEEEEEEEWCLIKRLGQNKRKVND